MADLVTNISLSALAASALGVAFPAFQYFHTKRIEAKRREFETYHELLKVISRGTDKDGPLKLVSQLAYIYELRNFKAYRNLTPRLLKRLQDEWAQNDPGNTNNEALAKEITETCAALRGG